MVFTTDALVLKSIEVGDNDRLLTLLTPENGRISVMAKGVKSIKSKTSAISQPFIYGNYEIYRKFDMNWLRGGSLIEYFPGIRENIEGLSLATYLSDVASEITGEFVPCVDILRMTLNTLYAMSKKIRPLNQLKAVYEWRAAGYAGYMPNINKCYRCGCQSCELVYLDVMNGRIICSDCLHKLGQTPQKPVDMIYDDAEYERSILMPLGESALAAIRFSLTAVPERMFSFSITDEIEREQFCNAAEVYLLNHLERGFESLNFYKIITK